MNRFCWVALSLACLGQGCLFTPEKKSRPEADKSNGYYRIFFQPATSSVHSDSDYTVQWVKLDSAVSDSTRIHLFRKDAFVKTIDAYSVTRGDTGTSLWRIGKVEGGDGYRFKISDAADSSKSDFGAPFSIRTDYSGSIRITSPYAGEVLVANAPVRLVWTVTGSMGSYFYVRLFRDDAVIWEFSSTSTGASGSSELNLPTGLPLSHRYRIRLSSDKDSSLHAYSGYFTIQGETPDAYEIDDSASLAKPILENSWQKRTLTVGDEDWIRISAVENKAQLISLRSERGQYFALYDSAMAPAQALKFSSQLLFTPDYAGNYFLKVHPFLTGPYEAGLSVFDTSQAGFPGAFTAPHSDSVWAAGGTYGLRWNLDSLLFRYHGKLELYRGERMLQEIAEDYGPKMAGSKDTGSYPWRIDPWTAGGTYRIRMANLAFPQFRFYSSAFTITGPAPDAFEPDDSLLIAKGLSADSVQDRNLTLGDTDWVSIDVKQGRFYAAGAFIPGHQYRGDIGVGLFNLYMGGDLLDKDGKVLSSQVGPSLQFQFLADYAGKYFLRLFQVKGSGGAYHLRLREYDSLMTTSPLMFIAPDSQTVWRAGAQINLQWVPDSAMYGEAVKLELHLEDGRKSILSFGNYTFGTPTGSRSVENATANTGTFKWTSSTALTHSNRYRIKIINSFNPKIQAFSPYFTLYAPEDDSLEPNNDRQSATLLTPNRKLEGLTLTYGDGDWFRFQGTADRIYCIRLASPLPHASKVRIDLSGYQGYLEAVSKDTVNYLAWYCTKDSGYAFSVDVNGTWELAEYSLEFTEVLPEDYAMNITAPLAATVFQASATTPLSIEWNSRVNVGGNVGLSLWNSKGEVGPIGSAGNTGTYSWKTRSGRLDNGVKIAAGSDYYIRIVSGLNPKYAANSAVFTISP